MVGFFVYLSARQPSHLWLRHAGRRPSDEISMYDNECSGGGGLVSWKEKLSRRSHSLGDETRAV